MSTTVVDQRSDSASSQGKVTAALKPVPGAKTTRVRPVPAEVRLIRLALVSTVAVAIGKAARAMASTHYCRTAC
jgi:hypothetical protein